MKNFVPPTVKKRKTLMCDQLASKGQIAVFQQLEVYEAERSLQGTVHTLQRKELPPHIF